MSAMEVLLITASGLAAALIIGHQVSYRRSQRSERKFVADEAALEAAKRPAE